MGPSSRATRTTPRRTISSTMAQSQVLRTLAILLQRISLCPFRNLQPWDCWREAPMGCQYGGGKKMPSPRVIRINHLPDFFESAAASLRSVAMVTAVESLRLLFLGRRLVLVV